ncbi:MAG: 23S rRNA (adenine(2503)-C(2))-methyltransferase RlmN [Candidatus Hydrogenedentota bacterium]
MIPLYSLNIKELKEWFDRQGEKPFRLSQLLQWILKQNINDFNEMTNLNKLLRKKLSDSFILQRPFFEETYFSKDGTGKGVVKLYDNSIIETALIPDIDRVTVCVSTQVGCKFGCEFCASGKIKFVRNLTTLEIVEQVNLWKRKGFNITNVVMMGVGEPLDNYDNVVSAYELLKDPSFFGFGTRKITISTVGLISELEKLTKNYTKIKIAISLHSAIQEKREKIVPIAKKYTLVKIKKWIQKNHLKSSITLQYIVIPRFNSGKDDLDALIKFCKDLPRVRVNLIPYNTIYKDREEPDEKLIKSIADYLYREGVWVSVRKSRGRDINAACGQLLAR